MAGNRNNVIKRRDENDWQDFKDEANKNKEGGIGIKEKKEEKLQFSSAAEQEGAVSLEAARQNDMSVLRLFHCRTGRIFLLQREECQRTNMHLELENKKGRGVRL